MQPRTRTTAACLHAAARPERAVQLTRAQLAEHHAPGEITRDTLTRPAGEPPLWLAAAFVPALFVLGAAVLLVLK